MKHTLELFTSTKLVDASGALLKKLGLNFYPVLKHGIFDDYFEALDFTYGYVEDAQKCVEHIWDIGLIDDSSLQKKEQKGDEERYESMRVFACQIKPDAKFPRNTAVALTRAFNRVSTKAIIDIDLPTIVIMLQGDYLSIATCERSFRADDKGDKIGRVTMLRNINCRAPHPGHRQILERIANDVNGCTTFSDLYEKWLKSFSIDILSDKFFKDYKAIYENIVEYATGKRWVRAIGKKWKEHDNHHPSRAIMDEFSRFTNPEKAVRDYVKKLMGRIVFLFFLQKKGWMGVPAGDSWSGGDPYFLENLFKHSKKKNSFIDDVLKPLFGDINTNRSETGYLVTNANVGNNVKVPYLNGGLFEEDEYDKAKFPIGADLVERMLNFFSNYNFTIDENAPDDVEIGVDPEMLGKIFENLLEDNKDKGAFYTPKEIVQYMCQEALTAHLVTKTGLDEELLRSFVENPFVFVNKFAECEKANLLNAIVNVKICDPAIGSGAFPIGLLNELVRCKEAIYGNAKNRSDIKKEIIRDNIYGVDIEKGAVDIARLRFWLSLVVDEEEPLPLPNLDYKIMQGNSLLEWYKGVDLSHLTDSYGDDVTLSGDNVRLYKENLSKLLKQYFDESKQDEKIRLKNDIKRTIKDILDVAGLVIPESIDIAENDQFFLWHTWYNEVFVNGGGFDICIGNPPYVATRSGAISAYCKKAYKQFYKSAEGQFDLYSLFIEHGLNLLKPSGTEVLITESTFVNNQDFSALRELLLTENSIKKLIYLGENVFDSANVDVSISVIAKDTDASNKIKLCRSFDDFKRGVFDSIHQSLYLSPDYGYEIYVRATEEDIALFKNARQTSRYTIGEIAELPRGAEFGSDSPLITNRPRPGYDRLLVGRDIKKYLLSFENRYLLFDEQNVSDFKEKQVYTQPKLLIQRIRNLSLSDRIVATYDKDGYICTNTLRLLYLKDSFKSKFDLRFILGILNSSLINRFFLTLFLNKDIYKYQIERIPIPDISNNEQVSIISLVDEILSIKKSNPLANTSALEAQIDQLVYNLYGITTK